MAMTIHVDIVSAEGAIHSGLATMVYAPAEMGEVGIAPRHTAFISRLQARRRAGGEGERRAGALLRLRRHVGGPAHAS